MSLQMSKPDQVRPREIFKQQSESIKVPKLKTKEINKVRSEKCRLDAYKTGKQPN